MTHPPLRSCHSLSPKNEKPNEYLKEFIKESNVSKDLIKKQMMELVYVQVLTKLHQDFPSVPQVYQQNKAKWSKMFIKTKPLQGILVDFTNKIAQVLEKEINNNRDQLSRYLMHPRISSKSINAAQKIKDQIQKHSTLPTSIFTAQNGQNMTQQHLLTMLRRNSKLVAANAKNNGIGNIHDNKANQLGTININEENMSPQAKRKAKFDSKNMNNLTAQQKLDKDLQEMRVMNEEYAKILEQVKKIDDLVEDIEDTNNELAQDVEKFQQDVIELEKQKETHNPLQRLQELLDKWQKEEMLTEEDLVKFAGELWMTVSEFEKDLKDSLKGHDILLAMKSYKYQNHIDWIKNKFGFYIDYYETTLNELKLKQNRQMDRLMMQMNDIESRLMNCSKEESELAALIYNEVKFKTVADANSFITELRRIMSIMHLQIKQSEQEKNMMKEQINVLEDCKVDLTEQLENWQQMFKFYQSISLRFIKDLDLFKDSSETQSFLENNKLENSKQEEIIKLLQDKTFTDTVITTTQIYKMYDQAMKEIYTELYKMGIIPTQKIPLKKGLVVEELSASIMVNHEDRNKLFDMFENISQATNQILLLSSVPQITSITQINNSIQTKKNEAQNDNKKSIKLDKIGDKKNSIMIKLPKEDKQSNSIQNKGDHSARGNKKDSAQLQKQQTMNINSNQVRKSAIVSTSKHFKKLSLTNQLTETDPKKKSLNGKILEESLEDEESFISSKYLNNDVSKELKRNLRLSPIQIQELQFLIKRCLGKDLTSEESVKLFDSNIESFINSLNSIVINQNQSQIKENGISSSGTFSSKNSVLKSSGQQIISNWSQAAGNVKVDEEGKETQIQTELLKDLQDSKAKCKVPLGDCIQLEYNDDGELFAFSLRPKIASIVFQRDESDIRSLKEILKVVMYMNRLLHDSENLILGKRKQPESLIQKNKTTELSIVSPLTQKDQDDLDLMDDKDKDFNFKTKQLDQEVQVNQQQDEIQDVFKRHLVDLICRIAPYQRKKTQTLFTQIKGEKLQNYVLRGVQKNGIDYKVINYIKDLLDMVIKKVKDVPPFRRRVIELKDALWTSQNNKGKKDDVKSSMVISEDDNYKIRTNTVHSQQAQREVLRPRGLGASTANENQFSSKFHLYIVFIAFEEIDFDSYTHEFLVQEMNKTMQIMNHLMHQQQRNLKTISLNDEVDLFPSHQMYPDIRENNHNVYRKNMSMTMNANETRQFPQSKISMAKKFSNLSFHNNYTSFRHKLSDKLKQLQSQIKTSKDSQQIQQSQHGTGLGNSAQKQQNHNLSQFFTTSGPTSLLNSQQNQQQLMRNAMTADGQSGVNSRSYVMQNRKRQQQQQQLQQPKIMNQTFESEGDSMTLVEDINQNSRFRYPTRGGGYSQSRNQVRSDFTRTQFCNNPGQNTISTATNNNYYNSSAKKQNNYKNDSRMLIVSDQAIQTTQTRTGTSYTINDSYINDNNNIIPIQTIIQNIGSSGRYNNKKANNQETVISTKKMTQKTSYEKVSTLFNGGDGIGNSSNVTQRQQTPNKDLAFLEDYQENNQNQNYVPYKLLKTALNDRNPSHLNVSDRKRDNSQRTPKRDQEQNDQANRQQPQREKSFNKVNYTTIREESGQSKDYKLQQNVNVYGHNIIIAAQDSFKEYILGQMQNTNNIEAYQDSIEDVKLFNTQ